MPPKLRLTLFGDVAIQKGKKKVEGFSSRASEALFLYLACNPRPIARETLAELLWADRTSTQGLTNLRTSLTSLRKELDAYLVVTRDSLAFNNDADAELDVDEFETQLKKLGLPDQARMPQNDEDALALQTALDLYRGDFLEGFHLRDGQGFEEWVVLQRERLKRFAREGFRLLTHFQLGQAKYTEASLSATRWQKLDLYDEEACRSQMWALMRTGQKNAALTCYQNLKQKLKQDLDVPPSSATIDLFQRLQQIDFPPTINLPDFSSSFLGRKNETEKLENLFINSQTRLVTLVGTGGIGKTRLAVASARFLTERKPAQFLHGVYFVSLSVVNSAQEIPLRVAEAIGFVFQGTDPLQKQLLNFLKDREVLLVLDNFEHLMNESGTAIAFIVEMLREASNIKLLITSRERLNLFNEIVFDISGLDVPAEDEFSGQEYSAVALFSQNAQRIQQNFSLDDSNKKSVAQICRLVNGVPLAIELASAWMRNYSCEQIAEQIKTDLDFLASPYPDMSAGHKSLRAVFERSWSLLTVDEQTTFAQLSIFRGGFTLEAVEAVILQNSSNNYPQEGSAEILLSTLVDKSLLQKHIDGRYDIHPLLLQYASEKLSASSTDLEIVSARHTSHYLTFLTQLGDGESPEQRNAIRPERDNIDRAWIHAAEKNMLHELEQTTGILHSFYSAQSWFQEGIDLFEQVLEITNKREQAEANGLTVELLSRKARMHTQIGQLEKAGADLTQASTLLDSLNDSSRLSRVLDSLAITSYYAGDYVRAMNLAQESLQISESEQNLDGMAFSLNFLGSCAKVKGDYEQCRNYFQRAFETYQTMKDEIGAAMVLNNLGNLLQAQGNYSEAQTYYIQSSEIFKTQDHVHGAATTLGNAGKLAGRQGDYELAEKLLTESLVLKRKINDQRGEAVALAGLGDVGLLVKDYSEAKIKFLSALKIAQQIGDAQLMLDILSALALLADEQNQNELCQHLFAYVLNHNGTQEESRQRVAKLKDKYSQENGKWNQEAVEDVAIIVLKEK